MPTSHALDNPFWSSLCSRHRDLAVCAGDVARFPADFAPFLGVANTDAKVAAAFGSLIASDERVYLLGVAPELPDAWQLQAYRPLTQMICTTSMACTDGPEIIELSAPHRADVLALMVRLNFPSVRNARRLLDQLESMGVARQKVQVVVSRYGEAKQLALRLA